MNEENKKKFSNIKMQNKERHINNYAESKNNRKSIKSNIETQKDTKEKRRKTERQKIKTKIEKNLKKQDVDKEIRKLKNKKPINFNKLNKKNKSTNEPIGTLSKKKRMKWEMIIAILILFALTCRIGFIQFVQGSELQSMAYIQQTLDRSINPKRGTIYDSTGKTILAVSSTVETVSVTPTNIAKEEREKIATELANIFS